MSTQSDRPATGTTTGIGAAISHESAALHVTGRAHFTDDLSQRGRPVLHAWPVQAPHAHARVLGIDVAAASEVPGVVRVLTASDVPGTNDAGDRHDAPLFPSEVMHHGQAVCWVLGESLDAARDGAGAVVVTYEPLPSIITLEEAIAADSFQGARMTLRRGDVARAFDEARRVLEGETMIGGQEHFYLETQASIADVDDAGHVFVDSSTQHPSETQQVIAQVLGRASHEVTVQNLRMGGGFGGKEMQPHAFAAVAALGAALTGRRVRLRLNRTQDITLTGKRHPFLATWRAGFDSDGHLLALAATLTADGGWCLDLSEAILSRALCHVDNAYWIPHVEVHGRIARTHKTSQTAFRGFGGPQGMLVVEDVLGRAAPLLGLAPDELRRRNLYAPGQTTPYGQPVRHAERLGRIWDRLPVHADLERRRAEVADFNATREHARRAIGVTPVKFGISFNFTPLNQAGALVLVYKDGSVLVNHGGTEMGQGLHTKMLQVASTALGVPLDLVRLAPTRTDKVPNTSATAASSGADLNGGAVRDACDQIRQRLTAVAAEVLGGDPGDVTFEDGMVRSSATGAAKPFADITSAAHGRRVPLWAAGFYRTEGLNWDPTTMQGHPFKYFAYGVATSEVEVDGFTGMHRLRRVDIIHDVGDSLSPLVDLGQVEGAFVQGAGWLTLEDLRWDEAVGESRGRLLTQSASTYKLPSLSELPDEFNVTFLEDAHEDGAVYGSKGVGEPPLMLALSVREAIRQAVAAFGPEGHSADLPSPATPEATFWAIRSAIEARGPRR